MPGIFGIISRKENKNSEAVFEIMQINAYLEPFYSAGKYINKEMGIYVGWTCHRGSFCDCLPIINERKDIFLFYFGENFIEAEELDGLKARNHRYERDKAAYLVHMYEECEEKLFPKLNGCSHGLLLDIKKKKAILFNDRYGLQKTYYFENEDSFIFGNEAKMILAAFPELRSIDFHSLAEFLKYNCVLENRTIFKKLRLLPGGSCWTFFEDCKAKKRSYFELTSIESQPLLEKEFFYERLVETIQRILKKYIRAKDSIGINLGRSLGSRIILSNAQYGSGKFPCYTFTEMYGDRYDARVGSKIAKLSGQEYRVIHLGEEFLDQIAELYEREVLVSEGYSGSNGGAFLFLNRKAREVAGIKVSDNYGVQLLKNEKLINYTEIDESLFATEFRNIVNLVQAESNELCMEGLSFNVSKGIAWQGHGELSIEQSQLIVRLPFLDNDFVELLYRAPEDIISDEKIAMRLIREGNQNLAGIDTGLKAKLERIELFQEWVVEKILKWFFAKISLMHNKLTSGSTKRDQFKRRQKGKMISEESGCTQLETRYRDRLAAYIREIVFDRKTTNRGYYNRGFIDSILRARNNDGKNYNREINQIARIEMIHRLFIDN